MLEESISNNPTLWIGSVGLILALAYLLKQILPYLKRNGNNDINRRLKHIEENELHDLQYIRGKVDDLDGRLRTIEQKVAVLESKLK